jgi:glucosyltransferase
MDKISIIIPCFNEEDSIEHVYEALMNLSNNMAEQTFEFVFIDDGSTDNTIDSIVRISKKDIRVRYYSFSRNFGKEAAMYAGLAHSSGDYVAIIDADLQDPPNLISEMYMMMKEDGYDCVAARRKTRKGEPRVRSFFAKSFYKIINIISDVNITEGARDFRLMTRAMVDAVLKMVEYNRFSKGIFGWVGFKTKWLEYDHSERIAGNTKWSFWKLFLYAMDGIVAFSTKPLAIASYAGLLFCLLSIILIIVVFIRTLIFGDPVAGWPSLICIISFIGGLQLFCIGILGQYLAKIYLETKKRPIYIIKSSNADVAVL